MRTALVTLLGAFTCLVVALFMATVQATTGHILFGYTWWFVVPVGAFFSGLAAASGYYAGCRLVQLKPGRVILISVLLLSVLTFFAIYWLQFIDTLNRLRFDSFTSYLSYALSHQSAEIEVHDISVGDYKLGFVGYLMAIFQIVGFAVGGVGVYVFLVNLPYCKMCGRYYGIAGKEIRFFSEEKSAEECIGLVSNCLDQQLIEEAIVVQASAGSPREDKSSLFSTRLLLKRCKSCKASWLGLTVKRRKEGKGEGWEALSKLDKAAYSPTETAS